LIPSEIVAVTVTLVAVDTSSGGVYRPDALKDPAEADQVTVSGLVPAVVAEYCKVCPATIDAVAGTTVTTGGGESVITAEPVVV
jgi:hypothetical protein